MSLRWFLVETVIYIEIPFTFFSKHLCLACLVVWEELNNFPSK